MIKKKFAKSVFIIGCLASTPVCFSSQSDEIPKEESHCIHFQEVPIIEFIRFVSKISHVNFIYDVNQLQFPINFSTGQSVTPSHIVKALTQLLRVHGFSVHGEGNYMMIHKVVEESGDKFGQESTGPASSSLMRAGSDHFEFSVIKLQYHQGAEILEAIKKIGVDFKNHPGTPPQLYEAIQSLQWMKSTNSLLCRGDEETLSTLKKLIASLDIPLRQVFIEVLVIETDVKNGLEFGLQWGAGGEYKQRFGFGVGNFPPANVGSSSFANTLQGIGPNAPPTGLNQIPVGGGFDLGVIGDLILHRGKTFLTLGALVSALQADGDSTIVLNQKIITQDNKNSKIFVGDNIPFPGSVVTTVGQSQQTTANIEYRDIGVSLSLTPMVGEGDVITLDIDQEITEAVNLPPTTSSATTINGIRSTKTNMVTHVHVPDKHFLVLSGMIRNSLSRHKTGLPCLGGIPFIGALFSKTAKADEKRNVIIFVRPHIIHSFQDYDKLSQGQKELFQSQSNKEAFDQGVQLVTKEP